MTYAGTIIRNLILYFFVFWKFDSIWLGIAIYAVCAILNVIHDRLHMKRVHNALQKLQEKLGNKP